MEDFEHINLNDVDDTFKPVPERVYTLEVNSLEAKRVTINKPTSALAGKEVLVLKGSYTIVDDEEFSGRKLWHQFWTPYRVPQIHLKKQMQATGVVQQSGESLEDYARQFAALNPPARFQAPVVQEADRDDAEAPPKNVINFFQAKPV